MDNGIEESKIEKIYHDFSLESQGFRSDFKTVYVKDEILTFEGVNFNSGLLSFEETSIECSIGSSKWVDTFLQNSLNVGIGTITMLDEKKIKFLDCKFSDDTYFKKDFEHLEFVKCIFEQRCYINNQYEGNDKQISIQNLIIKETKFNGNFKLHKTVINKFIIRDTDFIKNADFFRSEFKNIDEKKIDFHAINFHELALFGDTIFEQFLQFRYVTFKGYTHFRSAVFKKGLDLEYANIEKEMNFFNVQELDNNISRVNTSQETYRIIKYQLEKVGNIIAANKYQALELEKHRQNIWKEMKNDSESCLFPKKSLDILVAFAHWVSSDNSRNWLLTLFWIFIVGIGTSYLLGLDFTLENTFKYISIIHFDDCIKNKPIIAVFNKVLLGYLYYQFLTAIRKNTRK